MGMRPAIDKEGKHGFVLTLPVACQQCGTRFDMVGGDDKCPSCGKGKPFLLVESTPHRLQGKKW